VSSTGIWLCKYLMLLFYHDDDNHRYDELSCLLHAAIYDTIFIIRSKTDYFEAITYVPPHTVHIATPPL